MIITSDIPVTSSENKNVESPVIDGSSKHEDTQQEVQPDSSLISLKDDSTKYHLKYSSVNAAMNLTRTLNRKERSTGKNATRPDVVVKSIIRSLKRYCTNLVKEQCSSLHEFKDLD